MSIFRSGTVSKRMNYFVNKGVALNILTAQQKEIIPLSTLFLSKQTPRVVRILRLSSGYLFPVHQWSNHCVALWMTRWFFIILQIYPNTMNARWHEGKRVGVNEKPQNVWTGSETWTQKKRPIPVILWFAFLHISQFKIISINLCHLMN